MAVSTTAFNEGRVPQRGRPRDASRDDALRQAALEVMAEVGYRALTMDAVAARAQEPPVLDTVLPTLPPAAALAYVQLYRLSYGNGRHERTLHGQILPHRRAGRPPALLRVAGEPRPRRAPPIPAISVCNRPPRPQPNPTTRPLSPMCSIALWVSEPAILCVLVSIASAPCASAPFGRSG